MMSLRSITRDELNDILDRHKKWLCGEQDGRRADLSNANLSDEDLSGTDLSDAYLRGADLSGTDLSDAYLHDADLSGTDLYDAYLSGANLYGANLIGANLIGANLSGANLRGARNILAMGPLGSRGGMTYAVNHGETIMIQCGCYWNSLEAWEIRCREEYGTMSHGSHPDHGKAYAAAAAFIRAYAKAYGWNEQPDDDGKAPESTSKSENK